MDNTLFGSQLTDIFRIGLLCGLLYTMERTRAHTGTIVPLIGGIVFVAVIIASTTPVTGYSMAQNIVSGLAANSVIIAVLLSLRAILKPRMK